MGETVYLQTALLHIRLLNSKKLRRHFGFPDEDASLVYFSTWQVLYSTSVFKVRMWTCVALFSSFSR